MSVATPTRTSSSSNASDSDTSALEQQQSEQPARRRLYPSQKKREGRKLGQEPPTGANRKSFQEVTADNIEAYMTSCPEGARDPRARQALSDFFSDDTAQSGQKFSLMMTDNTAAAVASGEVAQRNAYEAVLPSEQHEWKRKRHEKLKELYEVWREAKDIPEGSDTTIASQNQKSTTSVAVNFLNVEAYLSIADENDQETRSNIFRFSQQPQPFEVEVTADQAAQLKSKADRFDEEFGIFQDSVGEVNMSAQDLKYKYFPGKKMKAAQNLAMTWIKKSAPSSVLPTSDHSNTQSSEAEFVPITHLNLDTYLSFADAGSSKISSAVESFFSKKTFMQPFIAKVSAEQTKELDSSAEKYEKELETAEAASKDGTKAKEWLQKRMETLGSITKKWLTSHAASSTGSTDGKDSTAAAPTKSATSTSSLKPSTASSSKLTDSNSKPSTSPSPDSSAASSGPMTGTPLSPLASDDLKLLKDDSKLTSLRSALSVPVPLPTNLSTVAAAA